MLNEIVHHICEIIADSSEKEIYRLKLSFVFEKEKRIPWLIGSELLQFKFKPISKSVGKLRPPCKNFINANEMNVSFMLSSKDQRTGEGEKTSTIEFQGGTHGSSALRRESPLKKGPILVSQNIKRMQKMEAKVKRDIGDKKGIKKKQVPNLGGEAAMRASTFAQSGVDRSPFKSIQCRKTLNRLSTDDILKNTLQQTNSFTLEKRNTKTSSVDLLAYPKLLGQKVWKKTSYSMRNVLEKVEKMKKDAGRVGYNYSMYKVDDIDDKEILKEKPWSEATIFKNDGINYSAFMKRTEQEQQQRQLSSQGHDIHRGEETSENPFVQNKSMYWHSEPKNSEFQPESKTYSANSTNAGVVGGNNQGESFPGGLQKPVGEITQSSLYSESNPFKEKDKVTVFHRPGPSYVGNKKYRLQSSSSAQKPAHQKQQSLSSLPNNKQSDLNRDLKYENKGCHIDNKLIENGLFSADNSSAFCSDDDASENNFRYSVPHSHIYTNYNSSKKRTIQNRSSSKQTANRSEARSVSSVKSKRVRSVNHTVNSSYSEFPSGAGQGCTISSGGGILINNQSSIFDHPMSVLPLANINYRSVKNFKKDDYVPLQISGKLIQVKKPPNFVPSSAPAPQLIRSKTGKELLQDQPSRKKMAPFRVSAAKIYKINIKKSGDRQGKIFDNKRNSATSTSSMDGPPGQIDGSEEVSKMQEKIRKVINTNITGTQMQLSSGYRKSTPMKGILEMNETTGKERKTMNAKNNGSVEYQLQNQQMLRYKVITSNNPNLNANNLNHFAQFINNPHYKNRILKSTPNLNMINIKPHSFSPQITVTDSLTAVKLPLQREHPNAIRSANQSSQNMQRKNNDQANHIKDFGTILSNVSANSLNSSLLMSIGSADETQNSIQQKHGRAASDYFKGKAANVPMKIGDDIKVKDFDNSIKIREQTFDYQPVQKGRCAGEFCGVNTIAIPAKMMNAYFKIEAKILELGKSKEFSPFHQNLPRRKKTCPDDKASTNEKLGAENEVNNTSLEDTDYEEIPMKVPQFTIQVRNPHKRNPKSSEKGPKEETEAQEHTQKAVKLKTFSYKGLSNCADTAVLTKLKANPLNKLRTHVSCNELRQIGNTEHALSKEEGKTCSPVHKDPHQSANKYPFQNPSLKQPLNHSNIQSLPNFYSNSQDTNLHFDNPDHYENDACNYQKREGNRDQCVQNMNQNQICQDPEADNPFNSPPGPTPKSHQFLQFSDPNKTRSPNSNDALKQRKDKIMQFKGQLKNVLNRSFGSREGSRPATVESEFEKSFLSSSHHSFATSILLRSQSNMSFHNNHEFMLQIHKRKDVNSNANNDNPFETVNFTVNDTSLNDSPDFKKNMIETEGDEDVRNGEKRRVRKDKVKKRDSLGDNKSKENKKISGIEKAKVQKLKKILLSQLKGEEREVDVCYRCYIVYSHIKKEVNFLLNMKDPSKSPNQSPFNRKVIQHPQLKQ
jgi:hypothetical protein